MITWIQIDVSISQVLSESEHGTWKWPNLAISRILNFKKLTDVALVIIPIKLLSKIHKYVRKNLKYKMLKKPLKAGKLRKVILPFVNLPFSWS